MDPPGVGGGIQAAHPLECPWESLWPTGEHADAGAAGGSGTVWHRGRYSAGDVLSVLLSPLSSPPQMLFSCLRAMVSLGASGSSLALKRTGAWTQDGWGWWSPKDEDGGQFQYRGEVAWIVSLVTVLSILLDGEQNHGERRTGPFCSSLTDPTPWIVPHTEPTLGTRLSSEWRTGSAGYFLRGPGPTPRLCPHACLTDTGDRVVCFPEGKLGSLEMPSRDGHPRLRAKRFWQCSPLLTPCLACLSGIMPFTPEPRQPSLFLLWTDFRVQRRPERGVGKEEDTTDRVSPQSCHVYSWTAEIWVEEVFLHTVTVLGLLSDRDCQLFLELHSARPQCEDSGVSPWTYRDHVAPRPESCYSF